MGVTLAGITGSGKTTVARLLGRACGARVVTVDTGRCRGIRDAAERLVCLAGVVGGATLRECERCVFDESLLTVYGYMAAVLGRDAAAAIEELLRYEASTHRIILLLAPVDAAMVRGRGAEPLDASVHAKAQAEMLRMARRVGARVVLNVTPESIRVLASRLGCAEPSRAILSGVA